jgi:hypothetical protein
VNFHPNGRLSSLKELKPGMFFMFGRDSGTILALAIQPADESDPVDAIAISNPEPDGSPAGLRCKALHDPFLVLPDATINLPIDREKVKIGIDVAPRTGTLILAPSGLLVALNRLQDGVLFFSVESGLLQCPIDNGATKIAFPTWEVAHPDLKGGWQTLCSVDVQSKS